METSILNSSTSDILNSIDYNNKIFIENKENEGFSSEEEGEIKEDVLTHNNAVKQVTSRLRKKKNKNKIIKQIKPKQSYYQNKPTYKDYTQNNESRISRENFYKSQNNNNAYNEHSYMINGLNRVIYNSTPCIPNIMPSNIYPGGASNGYYCMNSHQMYNFVNNYSPLNTITQPNNIYYHHNIQHLDNNLQDPYGFSKSATNPTVVNYENNISGLQEIRNIKSMKGSSIDKQISYNKPKELSEVHSNILPETPDIEETELLGKYDREYLQDEENTITEQVDDIDELRILALKSKKHKKSERQTPEIIEIKENQSCEEMMSKEKKEILSPSSKGLINVSKMVKSINRELKSGNDAEIPIESNIVRSQVSPVLKDTHKRHNVEKEYIATLASDNKSQLDTQCRTESKKKGQETYKYTSTRNTLRRLPVTIERTDKSYADLYGNMKGLTASTQKVIIHLKDLYRAPDCNMGSVNGHISNKQRYNTYPTDLNSAIAELKRKIREKELRKKQSKSKANTPDIPEKIHNSLIGKRAHEIRVISQDYSAGDVTHVDSSVTKLRKTDLNQETANKYNQEYIFNLKEKYKNAVERLESVQKALKMKIEEEKSLDRKLHLALFGNKYPERVS